MCQFKNEITLLSIYHFARKKPTLLFSGILQKGDGSRDDLTKHSLVIVPMMGSGNQRDFQCEKTHCEGKADKTALLNVVTMTTGPDGSIFVGDYNLIRKIDPHGNVFTILHFR